MMPLLRCAAALCFVLGAAGCMVETVPEDDDGEASASDELGQGEETLGCRTHAECPSGSLCAFEPGSCGELEGQCLPAGPDGVLADCAAGTVCGCDGLEYASACTAWEQGVSVWYGGSCDDPPPEPDGGEGAPAPDEDSCGGATCGAGEICFSDDGSCSASAGTCRDPNGVCTGSSAAVCGCDGVTYDGTCAALRAGVSVAYDGPC